MQWMKDGFALGVDRSLPGHPTYSMIQDDEGTSSEAMAYIGEFAQLMPFPKYSIVPIKCFACTYSLTTTYCTAKCVQVHPTCVFSNLCAICALVVEDNEFCHLKLARTLL